jgi:hypothetical protein
VSVWAAAACAAARAAETPLAALLELVRELWRLNATSGGPPPATHDDAAERPQPVA